MLKLYTENGFDKEFLEIVLKEFQEKFKENEVLVHSVTELVKEK